MSFTKLSLCLALVFSTGFIASESLGQAIPVEISKSTDGKWQMSRGGEEYQVKGAGGYGPLDKLAKFGGNSTRIWGVDDIEETRARLDDAHKNGISVALGMWLEHERHGFNYTDFDSVKKQIDDALTAVKTFKDHPAVLVWGIGNEMEGGIGDNPVIWQHVEYLAAQIKAIDPHHPTMTTIAEIGGSGEKVKAINALCPSIDIIGINSYGGASSLAERLVKQTNNQKPYIVTEFGPLGTWEVPTINIDTIEEIPSTAKAEVYGSNYKKFAEDKNCLGSYAFLWGDKQEGTATWFGMLLPDGRKTAAVDIMSELWTGKPVDNKCPTIESFELLGKNLVNGGDSMNFRLKAGDPEGDKIEVKWMLMADPKSYITGGDFQETPPTFDDNIVQSNASSAMIKAPKEDGLYRLYAFVGDENQGAACANIVFRVEGAMAKQKGVGVDLPFVIFDEPGEKRAYAPSGYMGETDFIELDDNCKDNPKVGATCLKNTFDNNGGWGGVVWQHPENDWGDKPGGMDLTGAKKLTFWARGGEGGEKVNVGFGILGRDKKFFDTAKGEKAITLTKEWQQFTFDLGDSDLSRIKTGFFWSLAAEGSPKTFYLDGVQFE